MNSWAAISYQNSCSFFELSLLEISLGEFHQVSIQHFLTLFLCKTEALIPFTSLTKHFKSRHVTTGDKFIKFTTLDKHGFLLLLDFVDEHVLHFLWSNLLSTLKSSIPLLNLNISFNSFLEVANSFINVSC